MSLYNIFVINGKRWTKSEEFKAIVGYCYCFDIVLMQYAEVVSPFTFVRPGIHFDST